MAGSTRAKASGWISSATFCRAGQGQAGAFACPQTLTPLLLLLALRDALTKMKDVYSKNPQMGDAASVDQRLAELGQNIEKLRLEAQKFEVWEETCRELQPCSALWVALGA